MGKSKFDLKIKIRSSSGNGFTKKRASSTPTLLATTGHGRGFCAYFLTGLCQKSILAMEKAGSGITSSGLKANLMSWFRLNKRVRRKELARRYRGYSNLPIFSRRSKRCGFVTCSGVQRLTPSSKGLLNLLLEIGGKDSRRWQTP